MEQGDGEAPDRHSSAIGRLTRDRVIALQDEAWDAFVDVLHAPIARVPAVKE